MLAYPSSDKAADAMLMLGSTRWAEGKKGDARVAWREAVKRHPGTSAARRAQAKLDQLK